MTRSKGEDHSIAIAAPQLRDGFLLRTQSLSSGTVPALTPTSAGILGTCNAHLEWTVRHVLHVGAASTQLCATEECTNKDATRVVMATRQLLPSCTTLDVEAWSGRMDGVDIHEQTSICRQMTNRQNRHGEGPA